MVTLVGLRFLNFVALDESCKLEILRIVKGKCIDFYDEYHCTMLGVGYETMRRQYKHGYEFMLLGMKRWAL